MYDLNKINGCLNTKIVGSSIIQYDSLFSTYRKARNIFSTCPAGTVILSEEESESNFCYPNKNIYFSIILKPFANNLISKISAIGCASIYEAVKDLYNLDCKIKWPGDLLVNENAFSVINSYIVGKGKNSEGAIISFEINANISKEELGSNGLNITSLMAELDYEVYREILIGHILNNIERHYQELIKKSIESAVKICIEHSAIINNTIEIMKKGKKIKNKVYVEGIDAEGLLIVKNEKGIKELISPGEIIII